MLLLIVRRAPLEASTRGAPERDRSLNPVRMTPCPLFLRCSPLPSRSTISLMRITALALALSLSAAGSLTCTIRMTGCPRGALPTCCCRPIGCGEEVAHRQAGRDAAAGGPHQPGRQAGARHLHQRVRHDAAADQRGPRGVFCLPAARSCYQHRPRAQFQRPAGHHHRAGPVCQQRRGHRDGADLL